MFLYHQIPSGVWARLVRCVCWTVHSFGFSELYLLSVLATEMILGHILPVMFLHFFFSPENISLAIITCQYNKWLYGKQFRLHWTPTPEELVFWAP